MKLGLFDLMEIRSYFRLDERIAKVEESIERLRDSFYNQTLYSQINSNGIQLAVQGFSIEHNVIPYIDTLLNRERTIERLKKMQRYFNDYLNGLPHEERYYLFNQYTVGYGIPLDTNDADLELYDEIQEIKAAINFMYGFPQEIKKPKLSNKTLNTDFEKMAEILGV